VSPCPACRVTLPCLSYRSAGCRVALLLFVASPCWLTRRPAAAYHVTLPCPRVALLAAAPPCPTCASPCLARAEPPCCPHRPAARRPAARAARLLPTLLRTALLAGALLALYYDAILAAMYALTVSAKGDCYLCVPPDPGIEAAALGASESALPGTATAEALHTFTLDSGASLCFFRDTTTLTPLLAPVPVRLADPSGGPVLAHSSTVLLCPAVLSGSLSGLHLPLFSMSLVSTGALQDAMVTTTTPGGQRVSICTCIRTSRHLAMFTHRCFWSSQVSASSPAPPCLPCVEGRQRAAPHSSSFPPTTAPPQTLHMDVWGPARVSGQDRERYFLQVADDYTRYTTVFPLRSKGEDLPVLRLHSNRGGEFTSDLLRDFCREEGILQSFTLPASPQQNRVAERRICLARTSMIHAAAPHFLLPFAVQYTAHQLNLRPCSRAFVRDTSIDKLSSHAIPCVFLGFPPDAPGWQFYHPTSQRVLNSPDVTFDESVPFYCLFPYRTAPLPPAPLFLTPGPPPVDPLPPQGPAPAGVSQVDPLPLDVPVEVAVDSGAARGAASGGDVSGGAASGGAEPTSAERRGAEPEGADPRGAESEGAESGGAEPEGAEPGGTEPEGAEPRGAESEGAESRGAEPRGTTSAGGAGGSTAGGTGAGGAGAGGAGAAGPRGAHTSGTGAAGAGGVGGAGSGDPGAGGARAGDSGAGGTSAGGAGAGGTGAGGAGASSPGGAGAVGPGGARTRGTRVAGAGGVGGAGAGDPGAGCTRAGGAGAGGAGAGDPGAGGTSTGGAGARGAGAGGTRAGGARAGGAGAGGAGAGGAGAGGAGAGDPRAGGAGAGGDGAGDPPDSLLPTLSPYAEHTDSLTKRREPESRHVSPVRTGHRVPRPRPPPVPGTHIMALRPSSVPLRVLLPPPPVSSLPAVPDPAFDLARAASSNVPRLLATVVTDPLFESIATSSLVAELVDFAAACRLAYAASLVAESESDCPPSVGGECAFGTDVLEDRQVDFECLAAAVPHLVALLLAPEGDPDAPDIPTPRSYAEAITGPYSSQWPTAMDAEMASWKSTGTYVDAIPLSGANIVDGMWIFKVKRPPGSPPVFKACYVARGFTQRDYELHSLDFSTAFLQGSLHEEIWLRRPPGFTGSFPAGTHWSLRQPVYGLRQAPREWHGTLRTTLVALGFAPTTADPSLFLRTNTSLPPFYVLVYVDDLVFATADTEALSLVKSELQKRHTCTNLGELHNYPGLQITRDRARRTITLTQSHMVHQVLQRFGFRYSSPQSTLLPTGHSLSAPSSDESVEPSGPYPELVGCLVYLMTCTRPDLAYPLSILAHYVVPGRHQPEQWEAAKRVLRYLCSTSGMGLVLGGRGPVVLTGHADTSWVDDLATQWSSQGYTFSLVLTRSRSRAAPLSRAAPPPPNRTALLSSTALHCPAAITPTAAMASPTILTFDAEGRAVDFDVWVDDLQLFLQCDSRDGVSLFDHTSGVSTAPAATADSTVRSHWTTRDAVARLAVRSHLRPAERAHFG
ncbi:unnamed protein product, partial [Closterium sp. NIES-54]